MPSFRKKIGDVAQEVAEAAQVIENVRSLQEAQKELANDIRLMGELMHRLETQMEVLKAQTKQEAAEKTQEIVNAVQGAFYQRLQDLAVKIAVMEERQRIADSRSTPALTNRSQTKDRT
jgi:propanediol dehydratase large subunit